MNLVQKAIRISAHILARDKKQLRSQLYGRLIRQDVPEIKTLLDKINQWKDGPWLRIISPSLIPPESPLIRTLEGHTDTVAAVSVLPEGKRAISGSTDGTLKIWDFEKWEVITSFSGDCPLCIITVTQDGKVIIADEASGKVHFLRLEEKGDNSRNPVWE